MKYPFLSLIGNVDALHPPAKNFPDARRYKEWHQFNVHGDTYDVMLNLGIADNLYDPAQGKASIILLAYHPERGWYGTADSYSVNQVRVLPQSVNLFIGEHSVQYDGSRYHVKVASKDGSIVVNAQFRPNTVPLPIRNHARFGGGKNDWIIVPRLIAEGELIIDGRQISLKDTIAYHDHNCGYWDWQDDWGWDWGYALQDGGDNHSIVFERVTDRDHRRLTGEAALVVWHHHQISKIFVATSLDVKYGPYRYDLSTPSVPRIFSVLYGMPRRATPEWVEVYACERDEWVKFHFTVNAGIEIILPHESTNNYAVIHELWGTYNVQGFVRGRTLNFQGSGFIEWARS